MKSLMIIILLLPLFSSLITTAQQKKIKNEKVRAKHFSIALTNSHTAMPFGKFAGLFTEPLHPGVDFYYGKLLSSRKKHDWLAETRIGYFFHRFVQHGIPLTLNGVYRFKLNDNLSIHTSLGAGYMHSIPATGIYSADENGDYKKSKGIGRAQIIANFEMGAGYTFKPASGKIYRLFISYQQRLQLPFVKSYVPILPYNCISAGISKSIQ